MITPKNPIADQAQARGESVPVGKTMGEIRRMGYEVPEDAPDNAELRVMPESPTGYGYMLLSPSDQPWQVAVEHVKQEALPAWALAT